MFQIVILKTKVQKDLNSKDKQDIINSKKFLEMKNVHVVLVKNINIVVEEFKKTLINL